MGLRKLPYVFTEHVVAMLSCVLNSETAIEVNIQIIRTFSRIRQALLDYNELRLEVEQLKNKQDNHDKNLEVVFQYLDQLIEKPSPRSTTIGFKIGK